MASKRLRANPVAISIFETETGTDRRRIADPLKVPGLFTRHLVALANAINIIQIAMAR
jgi:hypothetical protein